MSATARQWFGAAGALVALLLAGLAASSAIGVRYCPTGGTSCRWSPWLGLPSGLIALLALAACVRLNRWRRSGHGATGAWLILAATLVLALVWAIITLVAVAAATAD